MIKKINKKQYIEVVDILTRAESYNKNLRKLELDLKKLLKEKNEDEYAFDFVWNQQGNADELLTRLNIKKTF